MLRLLTQCSLVLLFTGCLAENQYYKPGSQYYALTNRKVPSVGQAAANNKQHKVLVAVIDSGVDYTNPFIAKNMHYNLRELNGLFNGRDDDNNNIKDDILGYDFTGNDGLPYYAVLVEDLDNPQKLVRDLEVENQSFSAGHGTSVAGLVTGGDPRIGIIPFRVLPMTKNKYTGLSDNNSDHQNSLIGTRLMAENLKRSIYMAKRQGARVANLSLETLAQDGYISEAELKRNYEVLRKYISSAATNMTIVTAAGNSTWDISSGSKVQPCQLRVGNILCVGAVDHKGNITDFSNKGLQFIDVFAPGVNLPAPIPTEYSKFFAMKPFQPFEGTSAAAPYVSNIVAKMIMIAPCLRPLEVIDILKETAHKREANLRLGNSNTSNYKYLIVNKDAAIKRASGKSCQ